MAVFFYNIFLGVFRAALSVSSNWNAKAKKWIVGRRDIFPKIKSVLSDNRSPVIWVHCSSVGEFEQGRPIIERIKAQGTGHKVFLTFFSPSGYEANKNYKGTDFIFYLPMDSPKNAKKFLDTIQPSLVIWVKYDYWFYYLKEIHKRNINCILISASFRKQQSFFRWYGGLQRKMLSFFTHLFVQNEESNQLLKTIGIENCTIGGDTRFDRVIEIAEKFEPIPLIEQFILKYKCIVAGSTWKDDEEFLKTVFEKIDDPTLKLIIAPHEITEKHLKEIKILFPYASWLSNYKDVTAASNEFAWSMLNKACNILIIDNIGMLSRLYNYAYITYVGGGFTKDGVHNVLEAAVFGKPVIFGPGYNKYREAIELIANNGGQSFSSDQELKIIFNSLLNKDDEYHQRSEASKNYVYKNRGATEKILQFIQEKRLLTS